MKNRVSIRIVVLGLLAAGLAGCLTDGGASGSRGGAMGGDTTGGTHDSRVRAAETARKEYDRALGRWQAAGIRDYGFRVLMNCYCFPMGWLDVEVEDGAVAAVDSVPGRLAQLDKDQFGLAPTVDHLFETVRAHLANPDFLVEAEYDEKLGYPRSVVIRNFVMLRDADYDIRIESLTPR